MLQILCCVTTAHATTTHALLNGLFSLWIHEDNYCIAMAMYFHLGI